MKRIGEAVGGGLVMAVVSTLGDFLWANWLPHHRPIYGLAHGTLLLLVVGLYLGAVSHKAAIGAAGGALIGLLAAGGFYLLQPLIGYAALFVLWIGLWVAFGLLNGRVLQPRAERAAGLSAERRAALRANVGRALSGPPEPVGHVLIRSSLAAVGSGIAFYAISGIWFPFNPHGWDYAVQFVSWTVAYLPAFAALLVSLRRGQGRPVPAVVE